MSWVYLDDGFPDHPKVVAAGGEAAWLFVCSLAYVKRYTTEGFIPGPQVARLTDRPRPMTLAARLVEVGLWEVDGSDFRIHDYNDWNRSDKARKEAARKAARARWGAPRNADASESHSEGIPEAHASTCPHPRPPSPLSTSPSSSSSTEGRQEEDERVTRALQAVAERRLTATGDVKNQTRWLAKVLANMRSEEMLDAEAARVLNDYPAISDGQLVDVLCGNTIVLRFLQRSEEEAS